MFYKRIMKSESVKWLSHIRIFSLPWTVACQAPLSMASPGKNTGLGSPSLLQGIFPTQDLSQEPQADSLPSEPPGKPTKGLQQFYNQEKIK